MYLIRSPTFFALFWKRHETMILAILITKIVSVSEIPRAFIVLKEGASVTDRDIIEYCKGKLANYKVPRKVDFVTELPMSANGKILRRKLREIE